MACLGENTLSAFLGGALDEAQVASVEAHLEGCAECRRVLRFTAPGWLEPGSSASGYIVESILGAGGMGVVYAARDPLLRRRVALKIPSLPAGLPGGQFVAEARAMARVSHRNVVTIYRIGELPGLGVFIAMELIEGRTARQWLAEKPAAAEAAQVFLQAARGLAAVHGAGLVHRDFKPENVLVGADGRVCVSDFGIAWPAAREADGFVMGSPAYMAPEQLRGEAVDARADVFSFCVALHEALTFERPLRGEVQALPPGLSALVRRGLSADRAARPELAELIEQLTRETSGRRAG
jgi:eukaryotic-like serine/threonine-protein kinase